LEHKTGPPQSHIYRTPETVVKTQVGTPLSQTQTETTARQPMLRKEFGDEGIDITTPSTEMCRFS